MLKRIFASLAILVTLASAVSIAQDWQPKYVTADQADIKPFHYSATVTDVYDGDTITVRVDLGFNVTISLRLRLHGGRAGLATFRNSRKDDHLRFVPRQNREVWPVSGADLFRRPPVEHQRPIGEVGPRGLQGLLTLWLVR